MFAANGDDKKSENAKNHAHELAASLKEHFAATDYAWRAGALVYKLDEGIPVYGIDRSELANLACRCAVTIVPGGCLSPYIQSIILGIVEGLTEFLPVSSTAHLRITEALMKIPLDDAYWTMYTIVIQLGAILALCLLFLSRIVEFMRTFPEGDDGKHTWLEPSHFTHADRLCCHLGSGAAAAQMEREEPGQPDRDGAGAADRRHHDVDCGLARPAAMTPARLTWNR